MTARRATDEEVEAWRERGWVVVDQLVPAEVIDAARTDLWAMFPTPDEYHDDPDGVTRAYLGVPPSPREAYTWPAAGPGFRPEQHRWQHPFPFAGSGALNRLCVHAGIVDFVRRALGADDIRLYQAHLTAKYTGVTNYEQPMHTDRNHSWLPPRMERPWWSMETFLYLSDVDTGTAPTHLVPVGHSRTVPTTAPLVMPQQNPELYSAEQAAEGPRGSLLAYRTDVFHRGVDLVAPRGSRFVLALAFKHAGHEWIDYSGMQSRANSPHWTAFVEQSTPRELELFGFPPPGHAIWNASLLDATALRYPALDLTPWRVALAQ